MEGGKNVVREIGNEDPQEKRLMQCQLICHHFVGICRDDRGSDLGKYGERDREFLRAGKCSHLQVKLMAGLSSVIH